MIRYIYFHPGDLSATEWFGICGVLFALPLVIVIILVKIFLKPRD